MRRKTVYRRSKKRGIGAWWSGLFMLLLAAAGVYIYTSPYFERVSPKVEIDNKIYRGRKKPVKILLNDNGTLKKYHITLSDGRRQLVLASGEFVPPVSEAALSVTLPKDSGLDKKQNPWYLTVDVSDSSLWNFFKGNHTVAQSQVLIDTEPPKISIVAASPSIVKGGSALVVYRVDDDNLKETFVEAGGKRFEVVTYKEEGYFATLIAWPFRKKRFMAKVVAVDKPGNKSSKKIPIRLVGKRYRVSWIRATDRFIDGKISEIARKDPRASRVKDRIERFRAVNEGMRIRNEKLIHKVTKKVSKVNFATWMPNAFYPLKSAKRVADFGDERHYYYKDKEHEISLSYHLGYDLASLREAPIYSSNPGKVVFASYNGIYGRLPIIDHGFGLYTLYGHCSELLIEKGDEVEAGDIIARTGKTGLALGDHLHFGILVQGVEVWPMDWMKENWLKSHIRKVFINADKVIRKNNLL